MVHFVRAVNIDSQPHHIIQRYFGNVVLRHQFAGLFRSRNRAFDFFAAFTQRFDKHIDGRAGADADVFVFRYEFHCFFSSNAFQFVLSSHDFSLMGCRLMGIC